MLKLFKNSTPQPKYKFITVKNYNGPGSGPWKISLLYCKITSGRIFFVPSDLYTNINLKTKKRFENNIFWSSKVKREETKNYLNFFHKNLRIFDYSDKKKISNASFILGVVSVILKTINLFWNCLKNKEIK